MSTLHRFAVVIASSSIRYTKASAIDRPSPGLKVLATPTERSARISFGEGPRTRVNSTDGDQTESVSTTSSNGVIVVGIDGSDGSRRALRWAIDEARQRKCAVEAVTAWPARGADTELTEDQAAEARRQADESERHVVDTVLRTIDDAPPISYETVHGDAVEVLVHLSTRAQLLVVGSHGTSSLRHAGIGSVSEACARLAACPVVVLPAPAPPEPQADEVATR
ncbi:MAG: universal stress protein [Nocardioidaceae bacterium]